MVIIDGMVENSSNSSAGTDNIPQKTNSTPHGVRFITSLFRSTQLIHVKCIFPGTICGRFTFGISYNRTRVEHSVKNNTARMLILLVSGTPDIMLHANFIIANFVYLLPFNLFYHNGGKNQKKNIGVTANTCQ